MKKMLAGILVSAMVVAMTAFPVAAATDSSVAGINFDAGALEPGDPGDPDQAVDGVVRNLNFYFGEQTISPADQEYSSVNNAAAPYNGMGEKVGYVVTNNTGSATQGWEVTVEISEFTQNGSGNTTMQGFTLTMTTQAGFPKAADGTSTINNAAPTATTVNLTAGTANAQTLLSASAGNGRGSWGANWLGKLKVLGGTANAGDAQAAMTWNLQAV